MISKPKPIFEKCILREVNFEQIDYDTKANFVIERVFELWRGGARIYYGDEKVTEAEALLKAKYLPLFTNVT